MNRGFFIIGTDTGVGKTVVTAGLVGALRAKGIDAVPYKPVQSGAMKTEEGLIPLDVEFYKKVVKLPEDKYNTYSLQPPLAPSVAAELSNVIIEKRKILEDYQRLSNKYELVVVEGAGGLLVPLYGTEFILTDLIKALKLPIVIVARPNLGTINHTLLTVKCAQQMGFTVQGIIYNGLDEKTAGIAEKSNPKIIEDITKLPTIGVIPQDKTINTDEGLIGKTLDLIEKYVDFNLLLKNFGE